MDEVKKDKELPVTPKEDGKYGGLEVMLRGDREIVLGGRYFIQEFEYPNGSSRVLVNGRVIKESYSEAIAAIVNHLKESK